MNNTGLAITLQVREEQKRLRPDINAPITGDVLNEMVYTRQVVKEVLRIRPPAPMVPQVMYPACFTLHLLLESVIAVVQTTVSSVLPRHVAHSVVVISPKLCYVGVADSAEAFQAHR